MIGKSYYITILTEHIKVYFIYNDKLFRITYSSTTGQFYMFHQPSWLWDVEEDFRSYKGKLL